MHTALERVRAAWRRRGSRHHAGCADGEGCSWDQMRMTYEEQAARGVPEAVRGLERIRQGRWPTNGRPRS